MTGTGRAVFYGVLLGTALTSVLANAGDSDTVSNTSVVPNDGTADAGANGGYKAEYGDFPPRAVFWNKMLAAYDVADSPLWGKGPVQVKLAVRFNNILHVDGQSGLYQTDMNLRCFWTDDRLSWIPSTWGNMHQVVFSSADEKAELIWRPDVSFLNIVTAATTGLLGVLTKLDDKGAVFWGRHIAAKFVTEFDFHYYPFDFQMLRITLASVKYSDNWQKLSFVDKDAALLRPNVTHALFRLSETSSGADTQYYKHLKDSYTTLHASVVIERQVTNFVFKLILPIWLIVITSSLGYWVNPKVAPARVGLAIVCVLTQISFSSSISKMLPAIAYLTWLDYFQFVALLTNCSAMLIYSIVYADIQDGKLEDGQLHVLDERARTYVPALFTLFTFIMLVAGFTNSCGEECRSHPGTVREAYAPPSNVDF